MQNAERMNCMEKRKARIKDTYTIVNLLNGKLELGFVVHFDDDNSSFGISFKEENEGDLDTLYLLLNLYFPRNTTCFLSELDNNEVLVFSGEQSGIAFANPYILDKWVVVNAKEKRLYTEDETREILASKNRS